MRDATGCEQCLPPNEHRQHLDRLAETHVVGKAATQPHPLEECKPAEPLPLIMSERSLKALRLILGLGPFSPGQFVANPFERLIDM